jgi:hypothetical protein
MRCAITQRAAALMLASIAGSSLAGCSTMPASLGEIGSIGLIAGGTKAPGQPVDVYTRIARGAKACWFGPGQGLATGYVFAAEVQPEDKGGEAVITIFDAAADNKRGLKAFAISMVKAGTSDSKDSLVGSENFRIKEPFAQTMAKDVERWAAGQTSCAPDEQQWEPAAPEAEPSAPAKTPKKGAKPIKA